MMKKILYVSLFIIILVLAAQSVSASDTDFDALYSNDYDLDDSLDDSSSLSIDKSLSSSIEETGDDLDSKDKSIDEANQDVTGDGNMNVASDSNVDDENLDVGSDSDASIIDDLKTENNAIKAGSKLSEGEDSRNATSINADPISFDYSSGGELKIKLLNQNGLGLANKTISVKGNGISKNLTTDKNGLAILKYSNAAGKYILNLSFNGDESYAPSNINTTITINKSSTKIKVPTVRSYLTSSTYVAVTLVDSKGKVLANKKIIVIVNKTTYKATTNSKGVAKVKIPTKLGKFDVLVKFNGDKNYTASTANSKVVITKMKINLIVPNVKSYITRNTYLKITLKNVLGKALAKKSIVVKVGKKTYKLTTNAKGVAKLKFKKKIATYKCTISFKATNSYYGASKRAKVKISKTPSVIKAPKVTFNSNEYAKFRINLTDADGHALRKKVVTVSIPAVKKVFKLKTNSKGIATLKFNGPKSYNVIVKYAGNKKISGKTVRSKLIVRKVKVKLNDVLKTAADLKDYISEKKSLPSRMKCGSRYVTSSQLSYLMAVAIKHISKKNKGDIVLIASSKPSKSSGEIYDTVYKKDYLKVASKAMGSSFNHKTPGNIKYSFYKIPYRVYTASFSRILSFYKENKKLPNYSLFTGADFVKVKNHKKYTFYLTTDNIAGKKSDLRMLKRLAKALKSKGYQAIIVGIGPDIHNKAYRYGCTGKNSVLLACFGGVDVGCIEEWTGALYLGDGSFVKNYQGAHVLGLWYSKPYGASASLKKPVGRAWDADYGFSLKNPAQYMSKHNISYIETGTVSSACKLLKAGKMGGPKLIK